MKTFGQAVRAGCAVLACGVLGLQGARAAVLSRVGAIDDQTRTALPASVSPRVATARDFGSAPADRMLSMSLRFRLSAAEQADLDALVARQQDPASSDFHRWLTPEQIAARFGMTPADLAAARAWLERQGFQVTGTARSGLYVEFTGTVAAAQQAFSTQIDRLQTGSQEHFANVTPLALPQALANVTAVVTGLDDFSPTPRVTRSQILSSASAPVSTIAVSPQWTSSLSGDHYVAPGDVYTIYDVKPALASGINGSGVTVAVMGQADIRTADIAAFRSISGLPASTPTVQTYGADPGLSSAADVTEAETAVEWAGAAAPGAAILFVTSTNVIDGSLTSAIDNNVAPVIVESYGICEATLGAGKLAVYNQLLQQAAAQGITVVAPAGNTGATACDYGSSVATHGLAIEFPGDSPYVTAVGGTMFSESTGSFWSSSNGAYQGSALSYIPEVAWNEDSSQYLDATGGGASLFFAKPSWQIGTGVPADFSRDVPDVSLNAAIVHDPYLICETGYCSSGYANSNGYLDVAGGTDLAAAEFGGFMALVVQKQGRVGVANNTLYALANSSYAPAVFHDVTAGSNASPCTTGSTGCASGGTIGYTAVAGYDRATGWGSVDVANLVTDWPLVKALATTPAGTVSSVTNLSGSQGSVKAGTSVTLTATVASGSSSVSSTPTGTVQFTVDGAAVGSAVTLTGGTATYTLATASLGAGTHLVQATYSGDATFSASKGAFSLNIASATQADFTLTPATATVTVASGGTAPGLVFTVNPLNGFTGDVSFTASSTSNLSATYAFSNNPVHISGTSAGTTTLTLFAYTGLAKLGTPVASAAPVQKRHEIPWRRGGEGLALASMMMLVLPRRRRPGALLTLLLAVGAAGLSGCGDYSNGPQSGTRSNTPPGTYTVTVSATGTVNGTAVTHSSTVTFIVQ